MLCQNSLKQTQTVTVTEIAPRLRECFHDTIYLFYKIIISNKILLIIKYQTIFPTVDNECIFKKVCCSAYNCPVSNPNTHSHHNN